ncbi:MAG: M57 family metalloprotease [Cytophagales bacterium]|nr:M57 family metalloprotease [Cytophagales bacterium]
MNNTIFKSLFAFLLLVICLSGCIQEEPELLNDEGRQSILDQSNPNGRGGLMLDHDHYAYNTKVDLSLLGDSIVKVYPKFADEIPSLSESVRWIESVDNAIRDWNDAGSCLQFRRVGHNENPHITIIDFNDPDSVLVIDTANNPESVFGWAGEPINGLPFRFIWINQTYKNGNTTPDEQRNIIGHELGHCIGFTHTDRGQGVNEIYSPAPDNSIMHSGIVSRTITDLVGSDEIAVREFYGDCRSVTPSRSSLTGPEVLCIGQSGTITVQGTGIVDTWIYSNNVTGSNETPISTTVTINSGGTATVTANFTDGGTASWTINTGGPVPPNVSLAVINGLDSLQSYQTELYTVNGNAFDSYSSVQWVVYSFVFPNAAQHFNVTSPVGNNPLNATVEVLSTAPTGTYYVQCRVSNACGMYVIDKQIHVQEGLPQIFPSF